MINFRKLGLLEVIVFFSALYVVSTLLWTASTRSAVEEKANLIKSNHKTIVDFINNQINKCDNGNKQSKTIWADLCNDTWSSQKIIKYININLNLKNPYSKSNSIVMSAQDPRLQAEGKAGQSTEMGMIFLSSNDFESEPG